jgi:hypothetical protein
MRCRRHRMDVFGGALLLLLVALNALFTAVGLQFGWWAAPVFAPLLLWLFACAACNRVLRPFELDDLRWRQRLAGAGMLAVTLWAAWPLWAGPTAGAWKAAHGGFGGVGSGVPRYPLGAVLGASPVAMGLVAFLLLALGMVLVSFAGCTAGGLWAVRAVGVAQRTRQVRAPLPAVEPDDPWIASIGPASWLCRSIRRAYSSVPVIR